MKRVFFVAVAAVLTACSSQPAPAPVSQTPAANTAVIAVTSKSPEAVAHFQKGEMLFDNLRVAEAAAEFGEALKLDPDFVQAHAYHGLATPGLDGLKEIEAAAAAAGALPEPERVLIEGVAAGRRGELAKAIGSYTRLTELAPGDWRGYYSLGQQLVQSEKYAEAVPVLKKAIALNPNAGGAQNMLGYASLNQGDADAAVVAFQEYIRILPQEPNPQDSLGEALLAAGRFKEAEAAFQKALDLSPQFWTAHEGIAYARLYAGDWKGGHEALVAAKASATRRTDKISVDDELAAVAVAQNDTKAALGILDAVEKTDGAQPSDIAFVPARRAMVLNLAGRYREALAAAAVALKTADGAGVSPGFARSLRRQALQEQIDAETGMRDAAAAARTSAALDESAAAAADDPNAQSSMHYGRGMLAVAKTDLAGARAHFDQCSPQDLGCKWQGVLAAEKAGDKAGAVAARQKLLRTFKRDPYALVMRAKLSSPTK